MVLLSGCATISQPPVGSPAETDKRTQPQPLVEVEKTDASILAHLNTLAANLDATKVLVAANVISINKLEQAIERTDQLARANQAKIEKIEVVERRNRAMLIAHYRQVIETSRNALVLLEAMDDPIEEILPKETRSPEKTEPIPASEKVESTNDAQEEAAEIMEPDPAEIIPVILEPAEADGSVAETNSMPLK